MALRAHAGEQEAVSEVRHWGVTGPPGQQIDTEIPGLADAPWAAEGLVAGGAAAASGGAAAAGTLGGGWRTTSDWLGTDSDAEGPRLVWDPKARAFQELRFGELEADAYIWRGNAHAETNAGPGTGSLDASLKVGAGADAQGRLTRDGVRAEAGVYVGVKAEADSRYDWGLASVESKTNLYAGGVAQADVEITKTRAHAEGEVFAGAKVAEEARVEIGGVGVGGKAEGWFGYGAALDADAGLHDGKFHLKAGMGIGWGLGGKLEPELSVDVNKFAKTTDHAVEAVGKLGSKVGKLGGKVF